MLGFVKYELERFDAAVKPAQAFDEGEVTGRISHPGEFI